MNSPAKDASPRLCDDCGAAGALEECPRCGLAAHEGCLEPGADCLDPDCRPEFRVRPATLRNLAYAVLRSLIFTAIAVWLGPLILRLLPACSGLAREGRLAVALPLVLLISLVILLLVILWWCLRLTWVSLRAVGRMSLVLLGFMEDPALQPEAAEARSLR